MSFDAVVIGGGGHVGLPLAIMLASRGVNTAIYDISKSAVDGINSGKMPIWQPGAKKLLAFSADTELGTMLDEVIPWIKSASKAGLV